VTDPNIDLARRAFEAFTKRNVEAVLEMVDPEVELVAPTASFAGRRDPYRGLAGIRQYFDDVAHIWRQLEVVPHEFREVGDTVVALGRVYGRGVDGLLVDSPAGWIWRMRDGKIVSGEVYTSREEALEAAGIGKGS
jgi:ketosteroid isomerase-like protein